MAAVLQAGASARGVVKPALHLRGAVGYLTFKGSRMSCAHTAKQAGAIAADGDLTH